MKALDIEVIPNHDMIPLLPEPEVKFGNTKDPLKRQMMVEEAKKKQIEKMGLNPITGRVCSFAFYGDNQNDRYFKYVPDESETSEIVLVTELLKALNIDNENLNIVTWNGTEFDFPYIYKRAALLKLALPPGVPGLSYWTKKYTIKPHCDLMQWWNGWSRSSGNAKLDYIGKVFLGEGKTQRDYNTYLDLIKNGEGEKIGLDNLCDVELTYNLYQRLADYLF